MGIKTFKPTTNGRRDMTSLTYEEITTNKPEKSLIVPAKKTGGRNNTGQVMVRFRGGEHKRYYRIIDFKRTKFGVPGKVEAIEYDPNRNCRIALISYADGEKRYIIKPSELKVGDVIASAEAGLDIKPGNAMKMKSIPVGTILHNIELKPGKGAQMARSAGGYAQLMGKEEKYVILRLPSGEMRRVLAECMATIGVVGNEDWANVTLGKAGRNRHRGIRPQTRGSAMNPVDHPHGGGEGKKNSGRHPVTPWGKPTKGAKTRRKKASDKLIISRRKGK